MIADLTTEEREIVDAIVERHRIDLSRRRSWHSGELYRGMLAREAWDALEEAHRETVVDDAHRLAVVVLERLADLAEGVSS